MKTIIENKRKTDFWQEFISRKKRKKTKAQIGMQGARFMLSDSQETKKVRVNPLL